MKNIITLLIILVFANCKAQQMVNINTLNQDENINKYFKDLDNNFSPFIGTWENTTGKTTLRVILYKTEMKPFGYPTKYYMDVIEGRFLLIENLGTINEIIIHDSMQYYPQSGQTSTSVIWGVTQDGITLNASITDNSGDEEIGTINGKLTFEINNTTNPLQAHWSVTKLKGLSVEGSDFNIPTDLILTKQ